MKMKLERMKWMIEWLKLKLEFFELYFYFTDTNDELNKNSKDQLYMQWKATFERNFFEIVWLNIIDEIIIALINIYFIEDK